jgi:hypothetical protein
MHALIAAAESTEVVTELPIPPAAIGILTMSTFVFLLLVTFAFRSVGTRHR